jgi:hypothetical protein
MVLASFASHTLRAHEVLGRPDALPGFLEVVHRFFEDGVFDGHDQSIRAGILRSPDCCAFSRERLRPDACYSGWVFVGHMDEDGEEREASYRCRRCADSR